MAYHIARENQQLGQFDEGEVRLKLSTGEFQGTDLCWTEGMADWKPLGQVVGLGAAVEPVMAEANPYAPPTVSQSYRPIDRSFGAPLATLGQRFGAAMLDGVIFLVGYIPLLLGVGMGGEGTEVESGSPLLAGFGGFILLCLIGVNIYFLVKYGQSIGKRISGIRVVGKDSDENPGPLKVIGLRIVLNGLLGIIPFYGFVDVLFIFGQERRCLHDLIAGTRVVQGQPESK
jgi:uncharacterized RDD family membrane protein YckC